MAKWKVVFYPSAGERYSPEDILLRLCNANEQAKVIEQLRTISELDHSDWPRWVKKVSNLFQITAGDFRVYFGLKEREIVVCYICRKVSQKAKSSDLKRANINFDKYLSD